MIVPISHLDDIVYPIETSRDQEHAHHEKPFQVKHAFGCFDAASTSIRSLCLPPRVVVDGQHPEYDVLVAHHHENALLIDDCHIDEVFVATTPTRQFQ